MQSQMICETLLDRREEWQNNTIREMQESLNSRPAGRYFVADYKRALVVVYGNSQIGKTSLILYMMGIKSEYREKVYNVLRANQERGDSSTVTAIIYMISPTDNYGMSFSESTNKEIMYYSEEEIIHNLSDLRSSIEKGKNEENILYIFIPKPYFLEDILDKNSFSIMDLPGINSRNELEKNHVESIVSRYMSMATVKMIVTKGDSIEDLASLDVPEGIDWRAFPNKYFVVVTMAFSQGNVKNYFEIEKSKRTKSFKEVVKDAYENIPTIIRSSEIEWYPVDVGESFQSILRSYASDAEEIIETQNYFTRLIREAIIRRNGNGLRNIIEDLKSYSKDYYRVNVSILKKAIEDKLSNIESKQTYMIRLKKEKEHYEKEMSKFSAEKIREFRELEQYSLAPFLKVLSNKIENFLNSIEDNYPARIRDHELGILTSYLKFVDDTLESCSNLKIYIGENLYEEIYPDGIGQVLKLELQDMLEQHRLELINMFRPKGVSYFFSKINRTDVISRLFEISDLWKYDVISSINRRLEVVTREVNAEKERFFQMSQLVEYKRNEENKLVFEIKLLKEGLEEDRKNLLVWEEKEKTDNELLSTYYKVARQEYVRCKTNIIKEMQYHTRAEKLQYLLLLGLMEQDYNAIMEEK